MFSSSVQLIDPDGRLVIVKIREGDEDLFLASVYAPCDPQNQCCFIQNLCTVIVSNTNTSKVIIVGDWNTTLHSIDKYGGRPWFGTNYRNLLLHFMDELGLVDAYRALHPERKVFTGFVKGRFIGQNVGLLNDIIEYADAKKLAGILLFIDFRKAFDTIEWNFIPKCIELYNFGPNIRKWISILYNNVESGVLNAGFMTNYFQVSRGVRQGCPLSPLLFVLSVELLALKIRQDQLCRGIPLPDGQNAKTSQFADDTTLILLK